MAVVLIITVQRDAFRNIYQGYTSLELYSAYLHIEDSETCSKDTCLILFHAEFPELIDSETFLMSLITLLPSLGSHSWETWRVFTTVFFCVVFVAILRGGA